MKNKKQSIAIRNINWCFVGLPRSTLCNYSLRGFRQNQILEPDEDKEDGNYGDYISSWLSN